ncbi:MAG: hypothetical protein ACI4CS_09575 [Candidatus Weimeria sp.]
MNELQNIDGVIIRDLIEQKQNPPAKRMRWIRVSRFATPGKKVRRCKS